MSEAADGIEGFFSLPPQRVAVVMIDFQNDFCSPEVFAGGAVTNTHNAETAVRANRFAGRAAQLGSPVVYTQQLLDFDRLTPRQRRWERPDGLCAVGSWGAELFVVPVPGAAVVPKYRFDCWQSEDFLEFLEAHEIDGLIICGVELICCVLFAVMGADERGYHYVVPQDLVSGQDPGDETNNKAVRDFLRFSDPQRALDSSELILTRWQRASRGLKRPL